MPVGIDHTDQLQERLEEQGRLAERWKAHHAEAFASLPRGTTVVINLTTGDYVTACGWHDAYDAFDQLYDVGSTPSFIFTVGEPIVIGWGNWLR